MDDITFDELNLITIVKEAVLEEFSSDEWYNLFGKRNINIYNSLAVSSPKFPCFIIKVDNPIPYLKMRTSEQCEEYTDFDLVIEAYNQDGVDGSKKVSKEEVGIKINKAVRTAINKKLRLSITSDSTLHNIDETVYRREVIFHGIMDNKNNRIYI